MTSPNQGNSNDCFYYATYNVYKIMKSGILEDSKIVNEEKMLENTVKLKRNEKNTTMERFCEENDKHVYLDGKRTETKRKRKGTTR